MGHSRVMHDWMRCRCDILFPSVQPHKSASNSLQDSRLPCADATLSLGLMDSSLAEIAPSLDLDLSPIQGQLASAVVNLNGDVIRGNLPPDDARLLFQMLTETSALDKPVRRLTVTYPSVKYIVARDETHVYIVQTRAG